MVEPQFWKELAAQNQFDFKRYGSEGKCIEARELVIALPESFTAYDPNILVQLFAEKFRITYGMPCTAALHHNKTKTNYHIHLIYSERQLLGQKTIKRATRNMFYDERGRHVRTKKEILDENGAARKGCRIVPKGEIYDMNYFSPKDPQFKSQDFLKEIKALYTDLINQILGEEQEHLTVFDPNGPFLPTKKIGKNNPMADVIRADNQIRQEWNRTAQQVMIEGVPEEEVIAFRKEEITDKISESIHREGYHPDLFADLIRRAVQLLKCLLQVLVERTEESQEADEKEKNSAKTVTSVVTPDPNKPPRPSSEKEEAAYEYMKPIHERLRKSSRKIYAIGKQKDMIQLALDNTPKGFLHRKDRLAIQEKFDELESKIRAEEASIKMFVETLGYPSVREAENDYWRAKHNLDQVRRAQDLWDGKSSSQQPEHPSILKQLKANKRRNTDQNREHHQKYSEAVL